MLEFSDIDFKILEFICKNEPVTIEQIKTRFAKVSSLDYRIKRMSTQKSNESCSLPNTSLITEICEHGTNSFDPVIHLGIYHITDLGQKALQDHKHSSRKRSRELWLKNLWIPIIVSFVTTVVALHIVPKLPYLLKWLIDIF